MTTTPPTELRAVLGYPAALLRRLPAAVTLACDAPDMAGDVRGFWVTTARAHYAAAVAAGYPAIGGHEWLALCIAAARGRARLALEQWLKPGYAFGANGPWTIRGSLYDLTGGELRIVDPAAAWDGIELRVTVGDVLGHFGARLVELDPPATPPRPRGLL